MSISEVQLLFNEMDVDGSGTLSKNEVQALMHQLGVSVANEQLETVMGEMDPNGDGQVDDQQFLQWWSAAGVDLKSKLAALADETSEQKDRRRGAQARVDAAREHRLIAQAKMREVKHQLQRTRFHAWCRKVQAIKRCRGGLGLRAWNRMTEQQRALHTAGTFAAGLGRNLTTASGRLISRVSQPQQTRTCAQCGAEFVLLAHNAPVSGVGRRLASKQEVGKLMEETEERKLYRKLHGERRLVPNRDLCNEHRPRLCRYSRCRRIFTLADAACQVGGLCCEDTVQF
jgi:hypothetical protein